MSRPLIADTGGLLRGLARKPNGKPSFADYESALTSASVVIVPALVLAEVDYFLRDERQGMQLFMQDLAPGTALVNEAYMPEPFGQTIPHYRIIEKSGGGASGVVSLVAM